MFYTRVLLLLVLFSCAYGQKMVQGDKKHYDHNVGIIGGHNISIEQVPYMVSLRYSSGRFHCGGSIIHERFILSAAHCVHKKGRLMKEEEIKVRVGTDKLNEGGKQYDVEKIIKHNQYNVGSHYYDVCILKLNETLTFGPTVNIVLLPADILKLEIGTLLNTTGWGWTSPNIHVKPDHLQQVTIPVASRQECKQIYPSFTNKMLCVGIPGKGSCKFDSGSPLTWNNVQVGITSFGPSSRRSIFGKAPTVYTKISAVKPWIKETIENHLKKETSHQKSKRGEEARTRKGKQFDH